MAGPSPLDRARRKAYWRLIPLCLLCYVIAYVDRFNVSIAKLAMVRDLRGFDNAVIGYGGSLFYVGYLLLEIPGTLLVERWSARRWIGRIMITWGVIAACTALVRVPAHFYLVRFLLGLAEAGFYPGVIVYFTHWFPAKDRGRAMALFLLAQQLGQVLNATVSKAFLRIGHEPVLGLVDWQWIYVAWGIPAVVMGVVVLFVMTDRPRDARWLTADEREALEAQLAREQAESDGPPLKLAEALRHPRVLLLTAIYFLVNTCTTSVELFLPSILERWYHLRLGAVTSLLILPPVLAGLGVLFVGWSSDRSKERRLHALIPVAVAVAGMAAVILTRGHLALTVLFFTVAFAGLKAYLPAFWALPKTFLSGAAAAGCIGLINSFGNLGGALGPTVVGKAESVTGSFTGGLIFLECSLAAGLVLLWLFRTKKP